MRAEDGVFAWLGPAVLMVSALLTAGYLFPVIVEAFFQERIGGKRINQKMEDCLYLRLWGCLWPC